MHPLKQALQDRRTADRVIEEVLKREFSPGAAIKWTAHAGRTYSGVVVRNCYDPNYDHTLSALSDALNDEK